MRRFPLTCMALLFGCLTPAAAQAATPTVAITDPANGALLTQGQPTFSGQADSGPTYTNQVSVNIYRGPDLSGSPVEVVRGTVTQNAFSVTASGLGDGTYTATATESDLNGDVGVSPPVTLQLANAATQLTLGAPPTPVHTPAPTFTGRALTGSTDATEADLIVYPGTGTDTTPVDQVSGPVAADGSFSIQVLPGLAVGTYTVVASQTTGGGAMAYSPARTFTVASGSGLSLKTPAVGVSEPQTGVVFSGQAQDAYANAATVELTLFRGASARGAPVGRNSAAVQNGRWSENWPTTLEVGTYTLRVSQAAVSGQATTLTRTFRVAAPGNATGAVSVSPSGRLSARIACRTGAGDCTGDVLILTRAELQPRAGGPRGPLSLMFERYSVAAGTSAAVSTRLAPGQLAALRRAGSTRLTITLVYSVGAKLTTTSRESHAVRVRRAVPVLRHRP